jgi:HEAT repeat protein
MRLIPPFAVAVSVLLLLCAAPFAQEKGQKPSSQADEIGGKTLDQWAREISSKDRSRGENAIRTIMMFGPDRAYEAVPVLLKELSKPGLDASIRVNGANALGLILGRMKDEPETRYVKDAVTILIRMLGDTQGIIKYRAAQALGRIGTRDIGPEAKAAIPGLIRLVNDPITWEVRQAAVQALGFIASDNEDKLGPPLNVQVALFGALNDPASQVRLGAIQSLTRLGAPANPDHRMKLLKSLEAVALKDPDASIRVWGHMAIMSVSHKVTQEHVTPIAKMLQHAEVATRVQAAQALGAIGSEAKDTVPALVAALNDPEPTVVMWVAMALGRMEFGATKALPMLEQLARDDQRPEQVRRAARDAVASIQGKTKKS